MDLYDIREGAITKEHLEGLIESQVRVEERGGRKERSW